MDISLPKAVNKLQKYKLVPLLFSPLEHIVSTVSGTLCNVCFNESELTEIECEGNIVGIDSNYIHKKSKTYKPCIKERKSNRGRKPMIRAKKPRKRQGDGSCLNSQISFTTIGELVRKIRRIPDKHSAKAVKISKTKEKIINEYKIKVFRNGSVTIPGVLLENLEDIKAPLNELCLYLSKVFDKEVKVTKLTPQMKNYKFVLLDGNISMNCLLKYCTEHADKLININFDDLARFLINPAFAGIQNSPMEKGWNKMNTVNLRNAQISFILLETTLKTSRKIKDILINFTKLKRFLIVNNCMKYYLNIKEIVNIYSLDNETLQQIMKYALRDLLKTLKNTLIASKDNLLSYSDYDPENYNGFIMRLKFPKYNKVNKTITIKIFPQGKINIDGATTREEAEFVYYWLNNLFYTHPEFVYNPHDIILGTDSEFSSEDEEC